MTGDYSDFLAAKSQLEGDHGFAATPPDYLYDFQSDLVEWALRKGRAALFADCGLGKAQPADEPVLTPRGWRPIGQLVVGDEVISVDGSPTRVVSVHPQGRRSISTVHFNDGASVRCDDDHLWTVATDLDMSRGRPWRTLTLAQLCDIGLELPPRNGPRWRVPIVRPVSHPETALEIDPYVLGVLLGDGSFRQPSGPVFTSVDPEIVAEVKSRLPAGMRISAIKAEGRAPSYRLVVEGMTNWNKANPFLASIKSWGLYGHMSHEKFIPDEYLTSGVTQRLNLLRGLMDTDGYVSASGTVQFGSSSPMLADGVLALVRSLGGVARRTTKIPTYTHKGERRVGREHHTLTIAMPDGTVPFLLPRKVDRCADRYYVPQRKIKSVTAAGTADCVCIAVAHTSQLYVTADYVVTHNTPMQLAWAGAVAGHTGKPVLIVTPLAVAGQTSVEAEKFGIDAAVSRDGKVAAKVTITNYDRIHLFDPADWSGLVCDESSAIKSFDGVRRKIVTEFARLLPYRLLATATAAPNDYVELGTSSEALGYLGHTDMLGRFFTNSQNTIRGVRRWEGSEWRFKGHAEEPFWRWVSSWARALRSPADLGYDAARFVLPPLDVMQTIVGSTDPDPTRLFTVPAKGLQEERQELARTVEVRCAAAAKAVVDADCAVLWTHINREGDELRRLLPDAVEVRGSDPVESKEEALAAFAAGGIRHLITKPSIAGWGLNWQHCHRATYFPSHSYEQWYQAVRRFWRFGQVNPVRIDVIATEGTSKALANLRRKESQADEMFAALTAHMRHAVSIDRAALAHPNPTEVPAWL